jgi:hypothetical protein
MRRTVSSIHCISLGLTDQPLGETSVPVIDKENGIGRTPQALAMP